MTTATGSRATVELMLRSGCAARSSEHPASVLVVDDDPAARAFIRHVLVDEGIRVVEAASAAAAWAILAREQFDALLLDLHLPDSPGLSVLARLRADPRYCTLSVILVTADDTMARRAARLDAGADDYVVKPFQADELVARVRARLRGHEAWQVTVDSKLEQRATLARAAARAASAGTLEEAAATIVNAVVPSTFAAGAALVLFPASGITSQIELVAVTGIPPWSLRDSQVVPHQVIAAAHRAAGSPGIDVADLESEVPTPVAFAPLLDDTGTAIGMLALAAPDASSATGAACLATVIDLAGLTGELLQPYLAPLRGRTDVRHDLIGVIRNSEFTIHFQPIVDLRAGRVVGIEALSRFDDGLRPDLRFRQAAAVGLSADLELATLERAIASCPVADDLFLSVNVSPSLVLEEARLSAVLQHSRSSLTLELSEQEVVEDYGSIREAFESLGPDVRVAVDDAGSGFASFRHILLLEPDFVKLDGTWAQGVERDPARQALITGVRHFTDCIGATLIAEGIERPEEGDMLRELEIPYGQGFLLGRPASASDLQLTTTPCAPSNSAR